MTRDEVLAMKPGRELDARIAHLVMGWHITSCETYPHEKIVRVKTLRSPEESGGEVPYEKTFTKVYSSAIWNKDIPHYSTDIAAAWEVAEKMSEEWPQFSIARVDTGWCVMWGFDGYGWPNVTVATAPEAIPEAICKAALLAVTEE